MATYWRYIDILVKKNIGSDNFPQIVAEPIKGTSNEWQGKHRSQENRIWPVSHMLDCKSHDRDTLISR